MGGVFSGFDRVPNAKMCFVMMPFEESFDAIYRLIHRCCEEQGLKCIRADEDVSPGKITSKIYRHINDAGIIIADMTNRNANVFYELGLAHAVSDNVILLTQSTSDVPFDLGGFLHIPYSNSFDGAEKLSTDLSKVITTILNSADLILPLDDERRKRDPAEIRELSSEQLDLGLLHLQAETARIQGDMKQAAEWLEKSLELAKEGKGNADEVGNFAITAENSRFIDLADALYEIAISRDPEHLNNRQCYVSFLLDHRFQNPVKFDLAGQILDDLEELPLGQERTRGLRAQYLTIISKASGEKGDIDQFLAELIGGNEFSSLREASPVLQVLARAGRFEDIDTIATKLKESSLSSEEQNSIDRYLADAYATSFDNKHADKAIEIYKQLLEKDLEIDDLDIADIKHNLATVLMFHKTSAEDSDLAYHLYKEAYSQKPSDISIRKGFAQLLLKKKMTTEAERVLAGEEFSIS